MKELDNSGECARMAGRGFARAGGVIAAVAQMYPQLGVKPVQVSNLTKRM